VWIRMVRSGVSILVYFTWEVIINLHSYLWHIQRPFIMWGPKPWFTWLLPTSRTPHMPAHPNNF
jgi:hypothetical protein